MVSLYACDYRLRRMVSQLKPTPGYCIFIDVVDSVALKQRGLEVWCNAICNVIAPARGWLAGLTQDSDLESADVNTRFVKPSGLSPLKVIGDCVMFYIRKKSLPKGADALTIFDQVLNIVRVPKGFGNGARPEVHVAITYCEEAYEITFVEGTDDIHGTGIDLAARLVNEAGPQEIVMNEKFYMEAKCDSLNWRAAGNVRPLEDGYVQFESIQEPCVKSFKGFKDPMNIYKWRGRRVESKLDPEIRAAKP